MAAGAPLSCNGVVAGGVATTYYVGADFDVGGGSRYFGTNQGGTIYQDSAAPVQ